MKISNIVLAIAISHICPVASVTAANILSNPGFEYHTPESYNIPGWKTYGQRIPNILTAETTTAISGCEVIKIFQSFTGVENYNGVYQEFTSTPKSTYYANGWIKMDPNDTLKGLNKAWIEVTFRDSANNILALYKSDIISAESYNIIGNWTPLTINNQYDPQTYA